MTKSIKKLAEKKSHESSENDVSGRQASQDSQSFETLESHFSKSSLDLSFEKSDPSAEMINNQSLKSSMKKEFKPPKKILVAKKMSKGSKEIRSKKVSKETPKLDKFLKQKRTKGQTSVGRIPAKILDDLPKKTIKTTAEKKTDKTLVRTPEKAIQKLGQATTGSDISQRAWSSDSLKSSADAERRQLPKQPRRISNMPSRQQTSSEIFRQISALTSFQASSSSSLSNKLSSKLESTMSDRFSKFDSKQSTESELDEIQPLTTKSVKSFKQKFSSTFQPFKLDNMKSDMNTKIDTSSRGVKKIKHQNLKENFKKIAKKLKEPTFLNTKDRKKEKKTCRICFAAKCSKKTGDLIVPCNCRGIFSTVHQKCISDWIVSMCSDTCDICRFKFFIKAKQKGLIDFIIEEGQFSFIWRLLSIILFSLYLVLIVSTFIMFVEQFQFMDYKYILVYKSSCSLIIFIMLSYVGYYFTGRYLTYRKWKKFKYHITVNSNPNNKFNEIITPPFDPIRSSGLGEYSIKPLIRPVLSD